MFRYVFQVANVSNVLQDGTLIDLCGATLLWRSAEGLAKSPVSTIKALTLMYSIKATIPARGQTLF
jgi:Pellino.